MKKKHLSASSRRQQIIIAADTVLQEVGVAHFTMDQVMDYLGVAKGTLYKYFNTKYELLSEVGVKALKLLLEYFKLSDADHSRGLLNTTAIIMSCYTYQQSNPQYFELIVYMERPEFETDAAGYKNVSSQLTEFMVSHIKREQKLGTIKAQLEPINVNYFIWGTCMGMMNFLESKKNFIENVDKLDRKKLFESYVETLVAGLAA